MTRLALRNPGSWINNTWFGAAILTLAAGVLRFADLDRLGFRIDEGFTLTYSRQDWADVLGLHGFYSPHPPLFFSLAKLTNLITPELTASRGVSALFGTATIPVFYTVCRRLGDSRIAFGAAALLTISPLHLEYSRDGRMYALVLFLTAVAWLAHLMYLTSGRKAWLVILSIALAAAFYADYSAAYAAVPLGVHMFFSAIRRTRGAGWSLIAGGVAVALYLPWIPQIAATVSRSSNATGRADYLGASWQRIWESIPVLLGFNRWSGGSAAEFGNAWYRWSDHRFLLFVPVAVVVTIAMVLWRRLERPIGTAILIVVATPLAAIILSLLSPGFAARTVMSAVLGWSILASVAFTRKAIPSVIRAGGTVAWLLLAGLQLMSIPAIYEIQGRDEWRDIAQDLRTIQPLGAPVLVFSTAGMLTDMLDLYGYPDSKMVDEQPVLTLLDGERETWTGAERWLDRGLTLKQMDEDDALRTILTKDGQLQEAVWLILRFGGSEVHKHLANLGYEPGGTLTYPDTKVVLYLQPDAQLGNPVTEASDFSGSREGGWSITSATTLRFEAIGESRVQVLVMAEDQGSARFHTQGDLDGLVSLQVNVRGPESDARVVIRCESVDGDQLERTTQASALLTSAADEEQWRSVRLVLLCPNGTQSITIVMHRSGESEVAFANVHVHFAKLPAFNP